MCLLCTKVISAVKICRFLTRVYAGILKSNVIPFKTYRKMYGKGLKENLSIHFKTSSPLRVLTGYIGDTLYLTFTIYSIDCPSSLSSNHLDADLHFPITNNRRKRAFALSSSERAMSCSDDVKSNGVP